MKKTLPTNPQDMAPSSPTPTHPAGGFSAWLEAFRNSLGKGSENQVPCGDCVGCCTSSYFIHVGPTETQALRLIPKQICVAAPGMPVGNVLMGHSPDGACPLLQHRTCTIYNHRPKTCRAYDCRVFAAAGITAGGEDKSAINQRVRTWRFDYPTESDRKAHQAVKAAARFIRENAKLFPGGRIPTDPSQLAILAIKVHSIFRNDPDSRLSKSEIVRQIVECAEHATPVA